jgi:hypothetical protein
VGDTVGPAVFRTALLALAAAAIAAISSGQTTPIPFTQVPCSGYALDPTPPPTSPPGSFDRSCLSFQAVRGERIQSSCSAFAIPITGQEVGIGCEILVGPLDGSAFAAQASAEHGATAFLSYTIPASGTYLVETLVFDIFTFFVDTHFSLELVSLPCVPDATSLCLGASRFRVTADWQTPDGSSGHAAAVPLTAETGYFWFFDPSNVEVVTKVLNGCSFDDHYWFFAGGLTNVGVQITVTDEVTGTVRQYSNPDGTPFAPIQDTTAFATCP